MPARYLRLRISRQSKQLLERDRFHLLPESSFRYGGDEFVVLFDSTSLSNVSIRLYDINGGLRDHFKNKSVILSF